jgi:hypothetical protein
MIRDRIESKKAVFFSPIRFPVAIAKNAKSPVASNVASGTLPGLFASHRFASLRD